ncbi:PREDICTED: uncharacterized protein LOC104591379 [Nelumbo nucifera]|uniref:Uncharacterized protein LOC104591379 n=2 Tax=Nelumbo nucifera TaxID=4432 RepID=A0A1U7ZKU9_NELNU|nr:PREDICTED: uncharacterized protein LOC104591379 [Nelumbo nucifera]DAD48220.1 TPA_asm: hypothetical protein HUJ06_018157 [Nelumbo nucifera]
MDPQFASSPSSSNSTDVQPNPPPPTTMYLHSIRKTPAKPWKKQGPSPPPRVYRVNSRNFRQVVQHLTGSPDHVIRSRHLQSVAPPPLNVVAPPLYRSSYSSTDVSEQPQLCSPDLSLSVVHKCISYNELLQTEAHPDSQPQPEKKSDHGSSFSFCTSPSSLTWSSLF